MASLLVGCRLVAAEIWSQTCIFSCQLGDDVAVDSRSGIESIDARNIML
jgi:hypothetical protein